MPEIMPLLLCLSQELNTTLLRQLARVAEAMLCMQGRVSMLGISRWSGKGGSYRTIQRFYHSTIPWCHMQWCLIKHYLFEPDDVYLLAGDETTVTKSGKTTHGLGRFFSSIYNRAVPGIGFFSLSLISLKHQKAYPVLMEQLDPRQKKTTTQKNNAKSAKGKRGRPKGSKNQNSSNTALTPYLLWLQTHIKTTLKLLNNQPKIAYFVYDGAFGNNPCLQMVAQCGLHLISKLHCNAALYFPYDGEYSGRGPRRKYGDKINYADIPKRYLKDSSVKKDILTNTYQMHMWHKDFPQQLNITIIQKTNLSNGKRAHVVLFSSALELSWENMISYYRLRFQIEFTFRDAKQHWGLEDFMNVKENAVKNAANLSMFMVNLSCVLGKEEQTKAPFSVHDIKARFHASFYIKTLLKKAAEIADINFIQQLYADISHIGCIHQQPRAA